MSTYTYEAYDKNSQTIHGEYEASSEEEVLDYLNKRYLTPISVKMIRVQKKNILSFQLFNNLNSVDILFLVRNLATTLKAGLSVVESLDILIKDTEKKVLKKVLEGVMAMIKNGKPLSLGFSEHGDLFPPIFIGMVKAGEVSGQLDKTLTELSRYLSREYALRSKIKTALTYPIILLSASVAMVVLMLMFVLPKLVKSFASSGIALPLITRIFIFISGILTWNYIVDLVVVAGVIWFFLYFRTTQTGKKFFFSIISRLPVASALVKKIALVRFTRTFGNLLGGGLSIIDSIEISSQSINNHVYTEALLKIIEDIKNGLPFSGSLAKYPELFPRLLVSLSVVGERTGSLHEILVTFSDFYEEEVDNTLKDLTSILEPVLLLLMGLMIGAIAISIILPIYQLVGHFV